jgi:hypothetical protein
VWKIAEVIGELGARAAQIGAAGLIHDHGDGFVAPNESTHVSKIFFRDSVFEPALQPQ